MSGTMSGKPDILAVIPVKKNSSRLPGKNIRDFNGEPLVERKIRQLQKVDMIDKIVLSTDCPTASKIAKKYNVEVDERPLDLANESRPLGDLFEYITNKYQVHTHLTWACCTSPLFDENWIKIAIDSYIDNCIEGDHDSLIVTTPFKHYMFDQFGPHNFKLGDSGHVNSQDLPELEVFTNGVVMAPMNSVRLWRYNYGPNAFRLSVPQNVAIDIDTYFDFECARCWADLT